MYLGRAATNIERIFAIVITYAGPNIPIRVWPPGNDDDWCIPSVMAYDANGGFVWGHQAVDRDDALAWTKTSC